MKHHSESNMEIYDKTLCSITFHIRMIPLLTEHRAWFLLPFTKLLDTILTQLVTFQMMMIITRRPLCKKEREFPLCEMNYFDHTRCVCNPYHDEHPLVIIVP